MTKLKALLTQYKWSAKDLYRKIEEQGDTIPYYALTQMVNGKRTNYNIITLKKICKALDVTPNDLIEEDVSTFRRLMATDTEIEDLGF
tara:strand:+ start:746 stop:1009 length:264 start_codon:yes stop_codon:yes gene_type:complete